MFRGVVGSGGFLEHCGDPCWTRRFSSFERESTNESIRSEWKQFGMEEAPEEFPTTPDSRNSQVPLSSPSLASDESMIAARISFAFIAPHSIDAGDRLRVNSARFFVRFLRARRRIDGLRCSRRKRGKKFRGTSSSASSVSPYSGKRATRWTRRKRMAPIAIKENNGSELVLNPLDSGGVRGAR